MRSLWSLHLNCQGYVGIFRLATIIVLVWSSPVSAQVTTASLDGTVVDTSRAVVTDANVTVRNMDTGFKQTVQTDALGVFLFPRLPVGNYRLTVEKPGFFTYVQDGITLTVNRTATQAVTLRVGEMTQTITVVEEVDLVTTGTSAVGQLVDERRIVDLPLNGRTAQSLIFLGAGTADTSDRYCGLGCEGGVYPGQQQAAVNGGGPAHLNYQLDGTGHNDPQLNMNLPFPNPDAIHEFNVQSNNLSAEFGNSASAVVNIVSKSGTNTMHGSLFEFLRNGSLNARNFFAPKHDDLRRNQFGGSIGGPIRKDKLFYFGTYQGTRIRSAAEGQVAFVPTQEQRTGDFSSVDTQIVDPVTKTPFPGNQIPVSRFSPVSKFFTDQWIPLPNGPDGQLTYAGSPFAQNDDQFMTKIDWNEGKQQVSGRYFFANFDQPSVVPKGNIIAASNQANTVRVQTSSVNHTYSASANVLFSTQVGWSRQVGGSRSTAPFSFADAGVRIATQEPPAEIYLPVDGYFTIDTNHFGNWSHGAWTFRENVSLTKGRHELHLGGELVRPWSNVSNTYQKAGYFYFFDALSGDNLADFMMGRASLFEQGGGEYSDFPQSNQWHLFVQDNWRITSRLTLQPGLRWDPFVAYPESQGRRACFVPGSKSERYPNAPVGIIYGGENHDQGCPEAGVENQLGNIAPRLGFAYRLTQDGKTSLRGGIGFYHMAPELITFTNGAVVAPFSPILAFNDIDFQDPYGSAGVPNPFPEQFGPNVPGPEAIFVLPVSVQGGVKLIDRNMKTPSLIAWNLTLERQFGKDWLFRAAYVGNKGTHLIYGDFMIPRNVNPAIYIPGQSTFGNIQERRIYKDFGRIDQDESTHNSNYNALQFTVERRFAHGLSVLSNYTWSKGLNDFGWTNPFDRRVDHGLSDDDIAHYFKFSGIWELPNAKVAGIPHHILNGWELTSNVNWRGGFPFSVFSGIDNSFSGGRNRTRADFLGGNAQLGSGRPHGELIEEFFDTSKFVLNAFGTFGNSGKNILRGPRFFNTDLGLLRTMKVTEHTSIQFRAEFFNIFNNVNFGAPNSRVSAGSFGRITSAFGPRILQFALKLKF